MNYTLYVNGMVLIRLIAGLSLWRPGFDPRPVHLRFIVDRFSCFRFSSVSTITPMVHTDLHLHVTRTGTNGRSLGTFEFSLPSSVIHQMLK
jgi:hypothetical protein